MICLRPIGREEVIFFILTAAGDVRVPARCWPLEVALEDLSKRERGELLEPIEQWPRLTTSGGRTFAGVDIMLRRLSMNRVLVREGEGWEAGYRLTHEAADAQRRSFQLLGAQDQDAVRACAQKLIECLKTWSKNSVVSRPSRSGTI